SNHENALPFAVVTQTFSIWPGVLTPIRYQLPFTSKTGAASRWYGSFRVSISSAVFRSALIGALVEGRAYARMGCSRSLGTSASALTSVSLGRKILASSRSPIIRSRFFPANGCRHEEPGRALTQPLHKRQVIKRMLMAPVTARLWRQGSVFSNLELLALVVITASEGKAELFYRVVRERPGKGRRISWYPRQG